MLYSNLFCPIIFIVFYMRSTVLEFVRDVQCEGSMTGLTSCPAYKFEVSYMLSSYYSKSEEHTSNFRVYMQYLFVERTPLVVAIVSCVLSARFVSSE
jgi:hypothetical protein